MITQEAKQFAVQFGAVLIDLIPDQYRQDFYSRLTSSIPGVDMNLVRSGDAASWLPKVVDYYADKSSQGRLKHTA